MASEIYLDYKTEDHAKADAVAVATARGLIAVAPDEKARIVRELRRNICRHFIQYDPENLRKVRKIIFQRDPEKR